MLVAAKSEANIENLNLKTMCTTAAYWIKRTERFQGLNFGRHYTYVEMIT